MITAGRQSPYKATYAPQVSRREDAKLQVFIVLLSSKSGWSQTEHSHVEQRVMVLRGYSVGLAARPAQQLTSLSLTPINMAKSREKKGFLKRCSDFLTRSSSEPPSQPRSSRPDRPGKVRGRFWNWISFKKSSTTLPSRSTSPLYPTSLTQNRGAETTMGKHSVIFSVRTQWLTQS